MSSRFLLCLLQGSSLNATDRTLLTQDKSGALGTACCLSITADGQPWERWARILWGCRFRGLQPVVLTALGAEGTLILFEGQVKKC